MTIFIAAICYFAAGKGGVLLHAAIDLNKKSDKQISGFDVLFIVTQIMLDWFNLSIHLDVILIYGNSL